MGFLRLKGIIYFQVGTFMGFTVISTFWGIVLIIFYIPSKTSVEESIGVLTIPILIFGVAAFATGFAGSVVSCLAHDCCIAQSSSQVSETDNQRFKTLFFSSWDNVCKEVSKYVIAWLNCCFGTMQ